MRTFAGRVVRPEWARRTVGAISDSQDESGINLYGVPVKADAYEDFEPGLYAYRQSRGEASYTGIVCDIAVSAIAEHRVRGHEAVDQTRVDALIWHHAKFDGPPALVTLLHRPGAAFARAVAEVEQREPDVDFDGANGYRQTLWRLDDASARAVVDEVAAATLYIADGHHRSAAALTEWERAGRPDDAGLLGVVHPMDGLSLSSFHRRVAGPVDADRLLGLLARDFEVRPADDVPTPAVGTIGVYAGSTWYVATLTSARPAGAAGLDVAILEAGVLDRLPPERGRVLTVHTVPAASPLDDLISRCDVDRGAVLTLAPPPPEALLEVADAGEVMPAKTTYFEPKPAAGMFLGPSPE